MSDETQGNRHSHVKAQIEAELKKDFPDWRLIENAGREIVDTDPEQIRFSVDAAHIQRLGEQLVGRQETAVSELIKNAFDADATEVTLTFSGQTRAGGTLIIEDDGSGMTDTVIRNSWMRISTTAKADEPKSPIYGRVRAGRKGIGRFSVQRLGEELLFESRPAGQSFGYRVRFKWDLDFTQGADLRDIFNKIERFSKDDSDHGTRLEIRSLRDVWNNAAIEKVWRSVILLQPPFEIEVGDSKNMEANSVNGTGDPGFRVAINGVSAADQTELFSIEKSFLSQSLATIMAQIKEDGTAVVHLSSQKLDLNDSEVAPRKYDLTGPATLQARYFIYQRDTLSGMNANVAANMGRLFGGIRVYRNGFRVLPYGEQRDDWLRLDEDVSRRAVIVPGNNRNLFGQVKINARENPLFEETSSREGLLENEAFDELRGFARWAIEWAILRIASARDRKQTADQKGYRKDQALPSQLIEEVLDLALDTTEDITDLPDKLDAIKQVAVEFELATKAREAAALEYEEMLRILASLGLSISVFGHEVKGARSALTTDLMLLEDVIGTLPVGQSKSDLLEQLDALNAGAGRLFDIGGYIAGLMSSTESRALAEISIAGAIERFAKQFSNYMAKQSLVFEIEIETPSLRTIPMHATELDSVLLNFLTNSIKSLKKARVPQRRIRIDAKRRGGFIIIGFEDNGVGIPQHLHDRIFAPFFTTTMGTDDDGIAGPGTGLGLKIVSDIAESYGGSVSVGEASQGYTARLEFTVRGSEQGSEKNV